MFNTVTPFLLAAAESHGRVGHPVDYAIIIAYVFGVMVFGLAFGRYAKSTSDFFFGGRRFAWWLVGMSCVATTVGSYSFIKYSQKAYQYGFSSTQTYLNDWFLMPFFMFGWLPIIYLTRVTSVPEYFERRFDRKCRVMATIIILIYLVGYVGYNFFMLGKALNAMLGWNVLAGAVFVAVICAIYVHLGGQTSVIMTDLAQGMLLLLAGFLVLVLGVLKLKGSGGFWPNFPPAFRTAFAGLDKPTSLPAAGVFWQDGMANGVAFYFMNQGILMRFMCAKSVRDGRKAAVFIVMLLMPLAAVAVSSAGWIGRAMVGAGLLPADTSADSIFVLVAGSVGGVGFFGLLMAALLAALMSTTDSLINAVSAITVNDIYRPFIVKNADDKHYLSAARLVAIAAALVGIVLVPMFNSFKDMYVAHANFVATVTPPMVVAIMLGAFWKRYTKTAAFATLIGGVAVMVVSYVSVSVSGVPLNEWLIDKATWPFAPNGATYLRYMRSLYGIVICGGIGVAVTLFTRPEPAERLRGLVMSSVEDAKAMLKGSAPNEEPGQKLLLKVVAAERPADARDTVVINAQDLELMKAKAGDMLYAADKRWWLGGLHSAHIRAAEPGGERHTISMDPSLLEKGRLGPQEYVLVEKIM